MMSRVAGGSVGPRWGVVALIALFIVCVAGSDPADARGRKKRGGGSARGYNPPYAAIVVDANSGQVMHASNADATRHPASLTKIMTLYLLFEQLEAGRLKLDSELTISAHAASMAPSKLGLRPGQTITVEHAIKALVTKSANDIAVAVAEGIAGDEEEFAKLMTRKARALGMSKTVYANASGLPDDDQITSARDQATLGRAIQDRFPRYYRYFSTNTFYYNGRGMRNHNHLLGRVAGVDGIKTGYIRASGFNLVASMRRDDRHVVAVVMGGASGRARDARVRQLLEGYIVEASARRTATKIAEAPMPAPEPRAAEPRTSEPRLMARTATVDPRLPVAEPREAPAKAAMALATAAPSVGSAEPIQPVMVRTVVVKRSAAPAQAVAAPSVPVAAASTERPVYGTASQSTPVAQPQPTRPAEPMRQVASAEEGLPSREAPLDFGSSNRPSNVRGEWMIQVGAFPGEDQARERLKAAQNVAKSVLGRAAPYTERVAKGDSTWFRARFAGFDKDRAEAACKYLKRNEFACLAVKN
jgi:D-alanyl-D-alanine carboxypeptidase